MSTEVQSCKGNIHVTQRRTIVLWKEKLDDVIFVDLRKKNEGTSSI